MTNFTNSEVTNKKCGSYVSRLNWVQKAKVTSNINFLQKGKKMESKNLNGFFGWADKVLMNFEQSYKGNISSDSET